MRIRASSLSAVLVFTLLAAARSVTADPPSPASPPGPSNPPPEIAVPRAEGLTLDGSPKEPAWASAAVIPCEANETNGVRVQPNVRVLASAGRLFVAVDVAEDPSEFVGVRMMVGAEGMKSSADALQLAYSPQDPRSPRYTARGSRGVGRETYRVAGAADLSLAGR